MNMTLNEIWKKFIRDEENDNDTDDTASYYKPRKRAVPATLVDEPDDDIFSSSASRTIGRMSDEYDDLDDTDPDEGAGKPRFKRVAATGIKSAEHAVDLMCRKYVVLVNTDEVPDEALTPVRCYLAGAIRALDAHITALDDENVFISIEPFDATPYLPRDEQDEMEEQEDDLI
jgi:hypothetical protein